MKASTFRVQSRVPLRSNRIGRMDFTTKALSGISTQASTPFLQQDLCVSPEIVKFAPTSCRSKIGQKGSASPQRIKRPAMYSNACARGVEGGCLCSGRGCNPVWAYKDKKNVNSFTF